MARGFVVTAIIGFLLVSGYGCGIKAHTYVIERERVDQANTGNSGFINGAGHSSSMAGRPTRKVYVMEIEREKKDQKKVVKPTTNVQVAQPSGEAAPGAVTETSTTVVPAAVAETAPVATVTNPDGQKITQYTVEKDDTLQKIAKKVYGSYGKWTKIYDANKDKIKNPNFVKPGTVLTIPQD
jgi:LysM repeat protein